MALCICILCIVAFLLLHACSQWKGEVAVGLSDWPDKEKEHLGQELSDVLIYLVRLAERCHIDLPTAVISKLELNRKKYPKDQAYGSSKKYDQLSPDK